MTGLMFAWTLVLPTAAPAPARLSIVRTGDVIECKLGDEIVTRYHVGAKQAKPYLWPINAPGNVGVTRDWPMKPGLSGSIDHPHQKSAWFCHGDVIPEGIDLPTKPRGVKGVDFWAETASTGKIVCTQVGEPVISAERGRFSTHNEWKTPEGKVILHETRDVEIVPLSAGRLIIVTARLKAAGHPVTFGDTKEGSLGVRVSDQLCLANNHKSMMVNSAGDKGEKECWGARADWCDYSGMVDGNPVGIAVFDHPRNPARACWHVRGYGLLAANPFGRAASGFPAMKGTADPLVRLRAGDELVLRYAIYAHLGDVKTGTVVDAYRQFLALAP